VQQTDGLVIKHRQLANNVMRQIYLQHIFLAVWTHPRRRDFPSKD
jgi:hypothetical protein